MRNLATIPKSLCTFEVSTAYRNVRYKLFIVLYEIANCAIKDGKRDYIKISYKKADRWYYGTDRYYECTDEYYEWTSEWTEGYYEWKNEYYEWINEYYE